MYCSTDEVSPLPVIIFMWETRVKISAVIMKSKVTASILKPHFIPGFGFDELLVRKHLYVHIALRATGMSLNGVWDTVGPNTLTKVFGHAFAFHTVTASATMMEPVWNGKGVHA